MFHTITIHETGRWTGLLWLLLVAVWLGSTPFVKPTIHRQSSASSLRHVVVITFGLYLLFGPHTLTAWLDRPIMRVTLPTALAGLGLVICGVAFSIWARLTLGGNWSGSATLKQDHTLILRGPYRLVRHPIYTGLLIALIGSALQHGLVRSFLALPICAVGLWLKILVEEQLMIQRFGEEYLRYRREVPAIAPFLF